MSLLLNKLKGNLTLDQAIEARLQEIRNIGQRSSSYVLKTVHQNGFTQTELHPNKRNAPPRSVKKVDAAR